MEEKLKDLEKKAKELRKDILDIAVEHQDGHIASAYSFVEIIVALYDQIMGKEDKFILSKGHGCMGLYAILKTKGYTPKFSGHPDIDPQEGIVCTTGSLGMGLSMSVGMAFARKFKKEQGHFFVVMGDGECQEGTIWESLNLARKFKLDNLTIIVDHNRLQALAPIKEIMNETNLKGKFEAFGAFVEEIDGHDFNQVLKALDKQNISKLSKDKVRVIIAHTIKGKGVPFMENVAMWHSKLPEGEQLTQAYKELQ